MTRLLLSVAALLALMSVDALAGEKKLTGAEIKAAYSDAKISAKNQTGTFLTVWKANGTMTGEFPNGPDKGKWWIKGDTLCRQWTGWPRGDRACFGVTLDGDKVKWWRTDGSQVSPGSSWTLSK